MAAATHSLFLDNAATERVVVSHHEELNPIHGVTIEAWIRPNTTTGCQTIVAKGFETAWWLGLCAGRLRYYTHGIGTAQDGIAILPVGEWTHVAVTFDGTTRRYYVNGELDFESVTPGTLGSNLRAMGIGGEGSSPSFPEGIFPFSGYISEVRVWRLAHTEPEIRQFMYRQVITELPGLVGAWSLENAPDDRFGRFESVLAPGASFSSLDSPPVPLVPLEIGFTGSINVDGSCGDSGYTSARRMPAWYEAGDRPVGEDNPLEILLGARANFLYVCLPRRTTLNDPLYSVELDTANHGTNLLENDDYQFRFWPGNDGLTTRRGSNFPLGGFQQSTWGSPVSNPAGLAASETPGAEFVTDFEMSIPRSIFADPSGLFRIRVLHNYLWNGVDERSVEWPYGSASTGPLDWQVAQVNLALVDVADAANPVARAFLFLNEETASGEDFHVWVEARDDVDIVLLEVLVDGLVRESQEYPGLADTEVTLEHFGSYATGPHTLRVRAFDHVGREALSPQYAFRVLVDGEPPRVGLSSTPHDPSPGQAVTLTAVARDPSGVKTIMIRDVLGSLSPSFRRCDFGGGNSTETCTWVVTPSALVRRLRVDALAIDSEDYRGETHDRMILFGNTGPDSDGDGLADTIEAGLCTDPLQPDTDFDGLSDSWEVEGIRFASGLVEPLLDYGVNPCWKNVLLQLDHETGAMPPAAGVQNLRNRYRQHDIAVYLEQNERPRPTAYPQSHLNSTSAVYQEDGGYYFSPTRLWAFYYGYERTLTGRSGAHNRFFTLDHLVGSTGFCSGGDQPGKECRGDFECPGGGSCGAGCARGANQGMACTGSSDCPLGDGDFATCRAPCHNDVSSPVNLCGRAGDMDYRLFHELGHAVGLGHGGRVGSRAVTVNGGYVQLENEWDSRNFKPQQFSTMNYLYNAGVMCMDPVPEPVPDDFSPRLTGLITYLDRALVTLNENALNEGHPVLISEVLAGDCSHASAAAFPVIRFTCKHDGVKYENISNGTALIGRRAEGEPWDFAPPDHPAGIDWDCDGLIEPGVASNINGPGWFSEDFFDGAAWKLENELAAGEEFSQIPNPPNCHILYRANCQDRAQSCYPWPSSYRLGIQSLDTGVPPVDCRSVFLATRSGECGGGSDANFGTGTCSLVDRDTPLASILDERSWSGYDALAALGVAEPDTTQEQIDDDRTPTLPGVERCDMEDNDEDGEIDEGCRDTDSDGVPDAVDNCETIANSDQADRDRNGLGDVCQFPGIVDVQAQWPGGPTIVLTWSYDAVPNRGVVVYRHTDDNPDAVYRGTGYPSTTQNSFEDGVTTDGTYYYTLQVLNLNGEEGEPTTIPIVVGDQDVIFADSFESP